MSLSWSDLTFTPSDEAIQTLATSWSWLLQEPFVPVLFSSLGDVFFRPESSEAVFWLNAGTGEIRRVAESVGHFRELLDTALANEWFMPGLVEQLHAAGKIPGAGQCYTYVTLPVFAEGKYEVGNLNPVPASDHFAWTGAILKEIRGVPDGDKVQIRLVD